MGAKVASRRRAPSSIASDGDKLSGGTFDLGDTPDLLPVVAALALRCDSAVEIVGTAHARFKETDRIAIVAKELSKLGRERQGEGGRPQDTPSEGEARGGPAGRPRRPQDVHGILAGLDADPGRAPRSWGPRASTSRTRPSSRTSRGSGRRSRASRGERCQGTSSARGSSW